MEPEQYWKTRQICIEALVPPCLESHSVLHWGHLLELCKEAWEMLWMNP
jgi:hypothetical protein